MSGDRGLVFIVDDDDAVGTAMARVLRASGFDAQHFNSASAFLQHRTDDRPACVLLDLRMPDVNGLELQKTLTDAQALTVVFLTGHADVKTSVAAMKAGAVDFLTKPVEEELLLSAVTRAVERSTAAQAGDRERVGFLARLARLTPRERQVGALVIQGLLNKQIAGELGTAEKTVKVHRARVMEKLKVGSVAELARLAERTRTLHVERPVNGAATNAAGEAGETGDATNGQLAERSAPAYPAGRSPLHAAAASAKRGRS
jgi:FixJ family two-component response regulator